MSEEAIAPKSDKTITVTVNVPSVMEADASVMRARIESATVESDEGYVALTDALGQAKRRRDAYEADRVKLKKPVLQLGKDIEEMFRTPLLILHSAIDLGKQKLLVYDALKRAEAEAQAALIAQAEAEARAREEEARRVAAEKVAGAQRAATAAAEAAQAIAEAATQEAHVDRERLRKDAIEARVAQLKAERLAGEAVAARDVAQAAVKSVEVAKTPALVRTSGAARRMVWGWNVTDFSKIDRKWLMVNAREINKVVALHKGDALKVLGEGFGVMYENAIGLTPNLVVHTL